MHPTLPPPIRERENLGSLSSIFFEIFFGKFFLEFFLQNFTRFFFVVVVIFERVHFFELSIFDEKDSFFCKSGI